MKDKNKVGRPKLANKKLKKESIIVSCVMLFFLVALVILGSLELTSLFNENKLRGLSKNDYISSVSLEQSGNKTRCNLLLNKIGNGKYKIVISDTTSKEIAKINTDGNSYIAVFTVQTKSSDYITLLIDGPSGSKKYRIHYSLYKNVYNVRIDEMSIVTTKKTTYTTKKTTTTKKKTTTKKTITTKKVKINPNNYDVSFDHIYIKNCGGNTSYKVASLEISRKTVAVDQVTFALCDSLEVCKKNDVYTYYKTSLGEVKNTKSCSNFSNSYVDNNFLNSGGMYYSNARERFFFTYMLKYKSSGDLKKYYYLSIATKDKNSKGLVKRVYKVSKYRKAAISNNTGEYPYYRYSFGKPVYEKVMSGATISAVSPLKGKSVIFYGTSIGTANVWANSYSFVKMVMRNNDMGKLYDMTRSGKSGTEHYFGWIMDNSTKTKNGKTNSTWIGKYNYLLIEGFANDSEHGVGLNNFKTKLDKTIKTVLNNTSKTKIGIILTPKLPKGYDKDQVDYWNAAWSICSSYNKKYPKRVYCKNLYNLNVEIANGDHPSSRGHRQMSIEVDKWLNQTAK